ncbi:MAG: hypothetical protein FJX52_12155, partial [Alphaproteobacteria bacterium]|nr:hypothetical protein [Alphaproteobacteria bacterium]
MNRAPPGPNVLITRPQDDAERLAAELAKSGAMPVIQPVITVVPRQGAALELVGVQAVLLTSANGARALAAATARRDLRVMAVGDATAAAARGAGFAAVESAGGDADDLIRVVRVRLDPKDGALLHVAGRDVAGDLAGRLGQFGFAVRRAILYQAKPIAELSTELRARIGAGGIDAILLFSPRTAASFVSLLRSAGLAGHAATIAAVCLSPAVASAIEALAWREIVIAAAPTQTDLLAAFDHWRAKSGRWSTTMTEASRTDGLSPGAARPLGDDKAGPIIDVEPARVTDGPAASAVGSNRNPEARRGLSAIFSLLLALAVMAIVAVATRAWWQPAWRSTTPDAPAVSAASPAASSSIDGQAASLRAQLAIAAERAEMAERQGQDLQAKLGRVEGDLAALRDEARLVRQALTQPASGEGLAEQKLAKLAEQVVALEAALAALSRTDERTILAELTRRIETVEAGLRSAPSVEPGAIAGLRGAAEQLSATQAHLAERLRVLEASRRAETEVGRRGGAIIVAVAQLAQALRTAVSFQTEFDALVALAAAEPALQQAAEPLGRWAQTGAATIDQLRQQFPGTASAVKQAQLRAAHAGPWGEALARLSRLVTIRRIDGKGEDPVDAALARAEQ